MEPAHTPTLAPALAPAAPSDESAAAVDSKVLVEHLMDELTKK